MSLFDIRTRDELKQAYGGWLEEGMKRVGLERQSRWTESIAVGSEPFVRETKEKLGIRAVGREIIGEGASYELRESETPYESVFDLQNGDLSLANTYYWNVTF